MKINNSYFIAFLFMILPICSFGDGVVNIESIEKATSLPNALSAYEKTMTQYINDNKDKITDDDKNTANQYLEKDKEWVKSLYGKKADAAAVADGTQPATTTTNNTTADEQRLKELEDDYKAKKENEQSTANKTLTALTTAATGIGGMELAMGLAEQSADKNAANSMAAYIATMRCTYANGKQVKAGPEEIELPGGNNQQLMNLRAEYFALANDLKERKSALGMQPGIESTEILDKSATGLYDDENIGITSGAYESLYRAQMLGAETDQAKIDEAAAASKRRVMGGAIAAGAGAVIGIAGNSLINGKLGEAIKDKQDKNNNPNTNSPRVINTETNSDGTILITEPEEVVVTAKKEPLEQQEDNFNFKYFEVPVNEPDTSWKKQNCQWHSPKHSPNITAETDAKVCKKYHESRCESYSYNPRYKFEDQSVDYQYCSTREDKEAICYKELKTYCFEKGYLYPENYKGAASYMNSDWSSYACIKAGGTPSEGKCLCNGTQLSRDSGDVITFVKCEKK